MIWELEYKEKPWTTNAERTWHFHKRAKIVKEWREAFCLLAKEANIPELKSMCIEVQPQMPTRRKVDTAAHNPASKAAIDGIVDAGVVPDDGPEWLEWIKFLPCSYKKNEPALIIRIIGEPLDEV